MDDGVDPVDDDVPSMARTFDFMLGGSENTPVDREFTEAALDVFPGMPELCRDLRTFSRAVVAHLARHGVDQFLELGSGLPTVRPVHEVAAAAGARPRVVYVDVEERTVRHARRLVEDVDGVAVVRGDVGDAAGILADPDVRATIDLTRPVAVLALGVLHYVGMDVAERSVHAIRDATTPGSALALSAMTDAGRPDITDWVTYAHQGLSYPPELREPEVMTPWLSGWELVPPGWVSAPDWTADGTDVPGPGQARSGHWGVLATRI
ncbi:SAM-dependent methyltransferase [Actinomycetospora endophytica]|uniref:SAM-dependent methyltransferase n=1 Tax=Actinomycetospora endophytica TaxID=2291215 RepID=A0ABS8P8U7_9PSEU|nr:SAM-dependent methyltransferase [Actinomycetospora endophytica]MCD2193449.1 SAM-dependent methyltransferase [Actinomycetospora endophytica]